MDVIEVKDVYKSFRIYFDKGATLKEKVLFKNRSHHEVHQVLKGVSFSIKKGEVIGLIGENGCGKSTLLKLMTRIIYPDQGEVIVNGKVSSLLELGAGFHPDMSGRENIYTNASIFGLTKKEIDNRIQDIIDFSELKDFIDNPVRTYSSGMYMRLAFSVAINVNADILLVDEILAVGDAAFQAKCFNKMQEIKNKGTTIVIVSHDTGSIEKLCNRVFWINDGQVEKSGDGREVIYDYLDYVMTKNIGESRATIKEKKTKVDKNTQQEDNDNKDDVTEVIKAENKKHGNMFVEITKVNMYDIGKEKESYLFTPEDKVKVVIQYKRHNVDLKTSAFGIRILRNDGIDAYGINTYTETGEEFLLKDNGTIEFVMNPIQLLQGEYIIDMALYDKFLQTTYCHISGILKFSVYNRVTETGAFRMNHKFNIY